MTSRSFLGRRRHPLADVAPTPTLSPRPPGTHRIVRGDQPDGGAISLGPGEWLVAAHDVSVETDAPMSTGREVEQGHGLCVIRLTGPKARPLIASGTTIDVRPERFTAGMSAVTAWHGVYTVLHVVDDRADDDMTDEDTIDEDTIDDDTIDDDTIDDDTIDMYVYRSYAEFLWELLVDIEQRLGDGPTDRGMESG